MADESETTEIFEVRSIRSSGREESLPHLQVLHFVGWACFQTSYFNDGWSEDSLVHVGKKVLSVLAGGAEQIDILPFLLQAMAVIQ